MPHKKPSNDMKRCIADCGECAAVCIETAQHCLHMGGDHAAPEHQRLMCDCAEICAAAVGFMARGSHYASAICRECSAICMACADDCDRLANGDETMAQCADACRRCAKSCEQMAGAGD